MNPSDVRLDALGFPIPPVFNAQPAPDPAPRKPARGTFAIRAVLVVLAIGAAVMAVVRAELGEPLNKGVAEWLARHAAQKYDRDDLGGALRDLDRAIAWTDKSPTIFALRGQIRLESGDVPGSLADFNKVVGLAPTSSRAFELRATALQRLDRHEDAIRDLGQAVDLRRNTDPRLLNARAYTRAVAQQELDEALKDIELAIGIEGENAHYLDTRGYIRFLLGDYARAREDLDLALELANRSAPLHIMFAGDPQRQRRFAREKRQHEFDLAVMYHHRGQIHEKLGNSKEAENDLRLGDKLGYNPAAGVY